MDIPLILAPMAGYSNGAMRAICHRHGAALTHTEMVSALGLLHASDKTWDLLATLPGEGPVVAHLYGSEPGPLAEAAARVTACGRFAGIDLNAGCPVRKVTIGGGGAALVARPQRVHDILAAMRRATTLPLTVKTRPGPHPGSVTAFELLAAAEEAGADGFALHARFTSQGHGGEPDLALLAEVKRRARIPVVGNGGLTSAWTAWRMWRETGVDGLMIARAAIGNPWIFREIAAACGQGAVPPPDAYRGARPKRPLREIEAALEEHLQLERELHAICGAAPATAPDCQSEPVAPEEALATAFRCHLFRYLHGLKGSSYLRGHLRTLRTLEDVRAAVAGCLEREAAYRAGAGMGSPQDTD